MSNISELENEILKKIQNNINNKIIDNKINTNEKTEYIRRIKDIKIVLEKYLQFFILDSKDDSDKFLNKINQKSEKEFEFKNNDFYKVNNNLNININIKISFIIEKEKNENKESKFKIIYGFKRWWK